MFMRLSTLLLVFFSFTLMASAQPDENSQSQFGSQYLTVNAYKMWEMGFEGQGYTIVISESGIGTRQTDRLYDSNGNDIGPNPNARMRYDHTFSDERILYEFGCLPNFRDLADASIPCRTIGPDEDVSHAFSTTSTALGRNDAEGSNQQGIARGANIITNRTAEGVLGAIIQLLDEKTLVNGAPLKIASINFSFRGNTFASDPSQCINEAIKNQVQNLRNRGIAVIAGAQVGPTPDTMYYPACLEGIISVGATTLDTQTLNDQDFISDDSAVVSDVAAFVPFLDLLAPARGGANSGAAPHVAGAFALLKQAKPGCTVDEMLTALKETGRPFTKPGAGFYKPRIDIYEAYKALNCGVVTIANPDGSATLTPVN